MPWSLAWTSPRSITASNSTGFVRRWPSHLVVFLPDQQMDLDDLERVTDLLGGRDTTPFVTPFEDRPFVIRVIKEPSRSAQLRQRLAQRSELSPRAAVLHACSTPAEVPPFGGDTIWSNQYLAYESLSRGLKETLARAPGRALGGHGLRDRADSWTR